MAFLKLAAIICDNNDCTEHDEDPIPEEQTRDWPTRFEPAHRRHLEANGWFITADHTLCPTHGKALKAAAKAEADHRALIESTHDPLFPMAVAG